MTLLSPSLLKTDFYFSGQIILPPLHEGESQTIAPWGEDPFKTPVLFLHGLLGQGRNMRRFQHNPAMKDRLTLTMDLRNHGHSPHGRAQLQAMAEDVHHTLLHYSLRHVSVVGHSLGGKIAMILALLYPHTVQSLLVLDIPPAHTGHGMGALLQKMAQNPLPDRLKTATEIMHWLTTISDKERIRQLLMQNIEVGHSPFWKIGLTELVEGITDLEGWPSLDFAPYRGSVSFLKGENSPYIQPEHHNIMTHLFPHHQLDTVPDAGHWLQVDNYQAFNTYLYNFIMQQDKNL